MAIVLLNPAAGQKIHTVISTNDYIKKLPPGSWVIAREQTGGRGRKNRSWSCFGEEKIIFSGKISCMPGEIPLTLYSPVCALAVYNAAIAVFPDCKNQIALKWPNDLYYGNKKFAGILIEPEIAGSNINLITGIGVNLSAAAVPDDLKEIATPLFFQPTGKTEEFTDKMVYYLNHYTEKIAVPDGRTELVKELNQVSMLNGKVIEFKQKERIEFGEVIEINRDGFLAVALPGGTIELTDATENMRIL